MGTQIMKQRSSKKFLAVFLFVLTSLDISEVKPFEDGGTNVPLANK